MPSTPRREPTLRKFTSYSPEQDGDMQATNPPTRGWGSGSYDAWGRPVSKRVGYGAGANVDCGHHTCDEMTRRGPTKGTTPGRW